MCYDLQNVKRTVVGYPTTALYTFCRLACWVQNYFLNNYKVEERFELKRKSGSDILVRDTFMWNQNFYGPRGL